MLIFRQFVLTMVGGICLVLVGIWESTFRIPEPYWLPIWVGVGMFVVCLSLQFLAISSREPNEKSHLNRFIDLDRRLTGVCAGSTDSFILEGAKRHMEDALVFA